jgi:hypothetical protein
MTLKSIYERPGMSLGCGYKNTYRIFLEGAQKRFGSWSLLKTRILEDNIKMELGLVRFVDGM